MIAYMLWATAVTALLGGAAHIVEAVLRARSRPGRWIWAAGMAGAVALPIWALTAGRGGAVAAGSSGRSGAPLEGALTSLWQQMGERMPSLLERLDTAVGLLWILASATLLTGLVGGFWRLARRARSWPRLRVGRHDVLISESFGPALLGVVRPRIVLPRSLLSQGDEAVALVCAHEAAHGQARDTWLLAGAALVAALVPWNAALWWQLMRLRAALELDCDLRVVADGVERSRYASLLLALGAESDQLSVPVPAFVHPPTLLERRLTMLIHGVRRRGTATTLALLAGAVLLTVAACEAPAPTLAPNMPVAVTSENGPMEKVVDLTQAARPPLVYVDGERMDVAEPRLALEDLDPSLIASITVLKGPSAVGFYGEDAVNGVILIELK